MEKNRSAESNRGNCRDPVEAIGVALCRGPERIGWHRKVRGCIARITAANEDPHFIAIGIAVGVFVGCTPTMPFHTIIALGLAFLLQGSKAAAALGTWICNPLTFTFLYLGSYKIGHLLLGPMLPFPFRSAWLPDVLEAGFDATLMMVAGGMVIGIAPAVVSYFLSRKLISVAKTKRIPVKGKKI